MHANLKEHPDVLINDFIFLETPGECEEFRMLLRYARSRLVSKDQSYVCHAVNDAFPKLSFEHVFSYDLAEFQTMIRDKITMNEKFDTNCLEGWNFYHNGEQVHMHMYRLDLYREVRLKWMDEMIKVLHTRQLFLESY